VKLVKEPFNNYVDKMMGGGGQKMPVFVHAQGIKTVNAKLCPRKDWIPKKQTKVYP
jgi:hypothetical protein